MRTDCRFEYKTRTETFSIMTGHCWCHMVFILTSNIQGPVPHYSRATSQGAPQTSGTPPPTWRGRGRGWEYLSTGLWWRCLSVCWYLYFWLLPPASAWLCLVRYVDLHQRWRHNNKDCKKTEFISLPWSLGSSPWRCRPGWYKLVSGAQAAQ